MAAQRSWSLDRRYPTNAARDKADKAVYGAGGLTVGLAAASPGATMAGLLRAWLQAYVAEGGVVAATGWGS